MRANLMLLAPIACFIADAFDSPGRALAQTYPYPAAPGAADPYRPAPGTLDPYRSAPGTADPYRVAPGAPDTSSGGYFPPAIPHDYPGPALRGGNGGG